MKKMKLLSAVIAAAMAVSLFAGCSQKKEQVEIKSGDDLWKLSIGVQSGTTGDTYTTRHFTKAGIEAVSYTHLDVYKRQGYARHGGGHRRDGVRMRYHAP